MSASLVRKHAIYEGGRVRQANNTIEGIVTYFLKGTFRNIATFKVAANFILRTVHLKITHQAVHVSHCLRV